jgi:atypical dual specificity phosphatase
MQTHAQRLFPLSPLGDVKKIISWLYFFFLTDERLGIKELYVPTVDHFEPSVTDLYKTVQFIQKYQRQGQRVYVHCRAGHGRSAAGVMAWLISQKEDDDASSSVVLETLNHELCMLRDVRKTLWKQPNLRQFHAQFSKKDKNKKNGRNCTRNDLVAKDHNKKDN